MRSDVTQADIDLLGRDPLFAGLAPKDLKTVADTAKVFLFEGGKEITAEGGSAGRFYLITEGEATVSVHGEEREVLGVGASFGEVSLLDDGPRSATVLATTPVRTISLAGFNFRPLLRAHPELMEAVVRRLCALLRTERDLSA